MWVSSNYNTVRPTVAEVDLRKLAANLRRVRAVVGQNVGITAVLKADAYGHGFLPIARLFEGLGICSFGVATVEEGVQLREAGIQLPILVLGGAFGRDHAEVVAWRLTPVITDPGDVDQFAAAAAETKIGSAIGSESTLVTNSRFGIHVKVDTGMCRLGVTVDHFADFISQCARKNALFVEGIATHFACAEALDPEPTRQQLRRFVRCLDQARAMGADPQIIHTANSAAALRFPETRCHMVRVGLALYGILPGVHVDDPGLEPAVSWRTQIAAVRNVPAGTAISYGGTFVTKRPSRIATLPVGYADGYARALSNRAEVCVVDRRGKSQRAAVVGVVCMDLCMIDITEHPHVDVGDTVMLIGGDGPAAVTADDLAGWGETISYEVLVGMSKRVPRTYLPGLQSAELGLTHMMTNRRAKHNEL